MHNYTEELEENNGYLVDKELHPMPLGSPLRTNRWKPWGISCDGAGLHELQDKAEKEYGREWSQADGKQDTVSKAAEAAGLGDSAQGVRDSAASVIPYFVRNREGQVYIFFHGAGQGQDAETVFNALDDNDKDRVYFTLLEPGEKAKNIADERMGVLGVNYEIIHASDIKMSDMVKPGSQHIFAGIASIHHHSHIPWKTYYDTLKKDGIIVVSDWHVNNIWTPEGMYAMFSKMEWEAKEEFMKAWRKAYEITDAPDFIWLKTMSQADRDMAEFWIGYHKLWKETRIGDESTAIWPVEGHRSPEEYMWEMAQVGFGLDSNEIQGMLHETDLKCNPSRMMPYSQLLMLTVGKK